MDIPIIDIKPEYFDILGLIAFTFLLIISIMLLKKKPIPKWSKIALFLISVMGIIIDGYIVIRYIFPVMIKSLI